MWHSWPLGWVWGAFLALEAGFAFSTLTPHPQPHILDPERVQAAQRLSWSCAELKLYLPVLEHYCPESQVNQNGQPLLEPLLTFKC